MNTAKTQFLMPEPDSHGPIRTFRRRQKSMLFKGDEPVRLMDWSEFREMQRKWPAEVEQDSLSVRVVWVLIPA